MKFKYFLMAALVLPCAMFTSCGSSDDDDDKTPIDGPIQDTKIVKQQVNITSDESFKPDASYIQKVWAGEYQGWDAVQNKNTTIRRQLVLNPNGTYINIIAGKLIDSGKNDFFKFESEGGKYTYNQSTRTLTYTCEYDSVLNYRDQSYTKYSKKHYYDHENANYTEKADFSEMNEGKRVWITKDMYLQSLTAEVLDLVFSMSEFDPNQRKDQNK